MYAYNEIKVYQYGFELLVSTAMNLIGIFLISYFMDALFEVFLFLLGFIPIRSIAGGYHAKHHWSCIAGFNSIYFITIIFIKNINDEFIIIFALLSVILSLIIIIIFAPVAPENKPLTEKRRKKQRDISIFIALLNIALILITFYVFKVYAIRLVYYISGSLIASILLVVPLITIKK